MARKEGYKMIKIEALKNYTIPYCGNKRIQPYGDLVISDGENRKTCKIQVAFMKI